MGGIGIIDVKELTEFSNSSNICEFQTKCVKNQVEILAINQKAQGMFAKLKFERSSYNTKIGFWQRYRKAFLYVTNLTNYGTFTP